jgi:hypothetical protein
MDEKVLKLLEEINNNLEEINQRENDKDLFRSLDKREEKKEIIIEYHTQQIQNTFDRIHDRVFNFNNILIGAFLVLGTFPSNKPILSLGSVIFPIINLIYMIILEIRQMKIHRFGANLNSWEEGDEKKHGKMINQQTVMSLFSFLITLLSLIYLVIEVFRYSN